MERHNQISIGRAAEVQFLRHGDEAAQSDSDGNTLMVSGLSFHVIAPAMNQNAGFDPVRDFAHVAHFGGTPVVLVGASLGGRG
jgi:hypothetical protein